MLAHLLREQGLAPDVISITAQSKEFSSALKQEKATVYISALPPSTLSAAVRTCRRVKLANPSCRTVVGVWSTEANLEGLQRRLDPAGADEIATRLSEAVVQIRNRAPTTGAGAVSGEVAAEAKRTARKPEEATDWATRELARAFEVPVSLVSLIETDRDFWRPSHGGTQSPHTPPETSFYDGVLVSEDLLVVEDVSRDDRFAANPVLVKRGVRAFASAPLRRRSGHLVGNLCLIDTQPRRFSDEDRQRLESIAAELMVSVEPGDPVPALATHET
jgi:GAF domain-containing protein